VEKVEAEKLLEQNQTLIMQRAQLFSTTTGIEVTEFESEAYMVFMDSLERWDGVRPFTTFLWRMLQNRLTDLADKMLKNDSIDSPELEALEVGQTPPTAFETVALADDMAQLGDEARHVCELILDGPGEALEVMGGETGKSVRRLIHQYIMRRGNGSSKSWQIMNEIHAMLS